MSLHGAVWAWLSSAAKWLLLARGRRPESLTMGDLRAMGVRVRVSIH